MVGYTRVYRIARVDTLMDGWQVGFFLVYIRSKFSWNFGVLGLTGGNPACILIV